MKDFLDHLMEISRFPELRWKRQFTAFTVSDFLAECIKTCIEIKSKYQVSDESITLDKALDIFIGEGLCVDVEPKNGLGRRSHWFALSESNTPTLWISPNVEMEQGQFHLFDFLAVCLLPTAERDLILSSKINPKTMDEYLSYPPPLIAVLKADLINALLRSDEPEDKLAALQSSTAHGRKIETVRDLERVIQTRKFSPVRRKKLNENGDQWGAAQKDANMSEIWNEFKSFCEVKDGKS